MAETGLLKLKFHYEGPPTRGAELVKELLETGQAPDGALTDAEANQAVAALEQLQSLWLVEQMVKGGEMIAEQVHTATAHGLQELVQNADDHGATDLRMGFRKSAKETQLLVVHNGKPVDLRDVVFMAWALLSGSRDDPERIGRFGIGLKTLNQISERLSVHCPPFRGAEISGGRIHPVKAPRPIKGIWSPQQRETLFVLRLREEAPDRQFFRRWVADWDASSLLFLRSLRRVAFIDLRTRKVLAEQHLAANKEPEKVGLEIRGGDKAERLVLGEVAGSRRWARYTVRYPSPRHLRRTHKAIGATIALSVAVPERGPSEGRLFAGLPLDEPSRLPVSLAAPFDINVSRTEIREQPNGFNEWLLDRLGDLLVAVALQRFGEQPKSGWRAVPIEGETAGESQSWLEKHTEQLIASIHERLQSKLRIRLPDGTELRTSEVVFEDQALDGLLDAADLERIAEAERRALPKRYREGTRTRAVLWDLGASRIDAESALEILDWDDDHRSRSPAWLVELAAAAIRSGAEDELWGKKWVVPAGSTERLSPRQVSESRLLLVHGRGAGGLAARVGQAQPLARPFLAGRGAAERVRTWLTEREVLRRRPTDADALAALARGDGRDPLDLRRDQRLLLRLRDAFADLDPESQRALGPGIGRNILLRGYTFKDGKRRATAVPPARAYLPSSIEKHEGWVRAAGKSEGIDWIHRDYATVLAVPRGSRRPGTLAVLRGWGAGVAPRLVRVADEDELIHIDEEELSSHQREELRQFPQAAYFLDDWISPDLDLVIADIMRERKAQDRRPRARALFLALHNNWREYADSSEVTVARYHYQLRELGQISATWIGRAATCPWLTTREKGLHPRAPRELIIDTGAVLGEADPSEYADEIEPQYAESPAAEALGLRSGISADDLVNALEAMREKEDQGQAVAQRQIEQVYAALATYCPGGANEVRSDLSVRQLQARFGRPTARHGLVRAGGLWLPPAKARRGPHFGEWMPRVHGAEPLWAALGVGEPDIADCVDVLRRMAKEGADDRSSEYQVFRHLLDLLPRQRAGRKELSTAPLRTGSGWEMNRPLFAVVNPTVAAALAGKLPMWRAPLPVEQLGPLLALLKVDLLDETEFEPKVSSTAAAGGDVLRPAWIQAVGHFREFLALWRPDLEAALGSDGWRGLAQSQLAVGADWAVRVPRRGRRAASIQVPAFLFRREPLLFCTIGEDFAGSLDAGGQAVASLFADTQFGGSDRVFLAMAWESAFRRRDEPRSGIDFELEGEEATEELELTNLPVRRGRTGARRRQRARPANERRRQEVEPAVRELIDPDEVDLRKIKVFEASGQRAAKLRITASRPLKKAGPTRSPKRRSGGKKTYEDQDREDVGYRLMERWLAERGINVDDTRNQPNVGADGVDLQQELYFELKAHAREAGDVERLESSEAELAKKTRRRYWLVIASGLEKGWEPQLLFISDPLNRLDTYLGGGIRLAGIREVKGAQPAPRR